MDIHEIQYAINCGFNRGTLWTDSVAIHNNVKRIFDQNLLILCKGKRQYFDAAAWALILSCRKEVLHQIKQNVPMETPSTQKVSLQREVNKFTPPSMPGVERGILNMAKSMAVYGLENCNETAHKLMVRFSLKLERFIVAVHSHYTDLRHVQWVKEATKSESMLSIVTQRLLILLDRDVTWQQLFPCKVPRQWASLAFEVSEARMMFKLDLKTIQYEANSCDILPQCPEHAMLASSLDAALKSFYLAVMKDDFTEIHLAEFDLPTWALPVLRQHAKEVESLAHAHVALWRSEIQRILKVK